MRVENYSDIRRLIKRGAAKTVSYVKTSDGVLTHLTADANDDRKVLITCKVSETFAANGGTAPTFKVGEEDTDDKFAATALFTSAPRGKVFVLTGILSATKALIVTADNAAGAGEGGLKITTVVFPADYTNS